MTAPTFAPSQLTVTKSPVVAARPNAAADRESGWVKTTLLCSIRLSDFSHSGIRNLSFMLLGTKPMF